MRVLIARFSLLVGRLFVKVQLYCVLRLLAMLSCLCCSVNVLKPQCFLFEGWCNLIYFIFYFHVVFWGKKKWIILTHRKLVRKGEHSVSVSFSCKPFYFSELIHWFLFSDLIKFMFTWIHLSACVKRLSRIIPWDDVKKILSMAGPCHQIFWSSPMAYSCLHSWCID